MKDFKNILKTAKITSVKSYKILYGTKNNIFAKVHAKQADSSWYCEIKPTNKIIINTKYYAYTDAIIEYNKQIEQY